MSEDEEMRWFPHNKSLEDSYILGDIIARQVLVGVVIMIIKMKFIDNIKEAVSCYVTAYCTRSTGIIAFSYGYCCCCYSQLQFITSEY